MSKMYVWEVQELFHYSEEFDYTLIMDDEKSFNKIKKLVMEIIRHSIIDCNERITRLEEINHVSLKRNQDWLESLKNKLEEVNRYEFISQFKTIELPDRKLQIYKTELL